MPVDLGTFTSIQLKRWTCCVVFGLLAVFHMVSSLADIRHSPSSGRIYQFRMTLSELACAFNARGRVPKLIIEGAARNRRISGALSLDDPEAFVKVLAQDRTLKLRRRGESVVVRERKDPTRRGVDGKAGPTDGCGVVMSLRVARVEGGCRASESASGHPRKASHEWADRMLTIVAPATVQGATHACGDVPWPLRPRRTWGALRDGRVARTATFPRLLERVRPHLRFQLVTVGSDGPKRRATDVAVWPDSRACRTRAFTELS